jgi:uncharacterized membrane protein
MRYKSTMLLVLSIIFISTGALFISIGTCNPAIGLGVLMFGIGGIFTAWMSTYLGKEMKKDINERNEPNKVES